MTEKLCHIDDIADPGARGFELLQEGREFLMFLVKRNGEVYGYRNQCPHARVNLEWREDDFLDMDKEWIQCSVHGALFRIETGDCVSGPCNGRGLQALDIHVDDRGDIFLKPV
ncbi:MAG: Rieske (2Fe-2S) protein [Gammaproteobacteria bacterium]|nr:MAG: Rieske (2Fe-2S) protein [Gammaproteobacteria bacterium]